MNHTPGPWQEGESHESKVDIISEKFVLIATVKGGIASSAPKNANARLIAAAPDLLAALSELLAEAEEFHNPNTEGWNMARAAIARATGAA